MEYIAIIGSRRRDKPEDFISVLKCFEKIYKNGDEIVSGGCSKGGDRFAERLAAIGRIPITIFKADWKRFGRGAGFVRNKDIAKLGTVLIACVVSDRKGGTEDTIKKFKKFHPDGRIYLV